MADKCPFRLADRNIFRLNNWVYLVAIGGVEARGPPHMKGRAHSSVFAALSTSGSKKYPFTAGLTVFQPSAGPTGGLQHRNQVALTTQAG